MFSSDSVQLSLHYPSQLRIAVSLFTSTMCKCCLYIALYMWVVPSHWRNTVPTCKICQEFRMSLEHVHNVGMPLSCRLYSPPPPSPPHPLFSRLKESIIFQCLFSDKVIHCMDHFWNFMYCTFTVQSYLLVFSVKHFEFWFAFLSPCPGCPVKTFAYVNIGITDANLRKCEYNSSLNMLLFWSNK